MSIKHRKPSAETSLASCREMSALKKAAGLRGMAGRINLEELSKRRGEIPDDNRNLTGVVMGDPLPGDRRRTWCPWLQNAEAL